jgi:deaminated glutathione amidase
MRRDVGQRTWRVAAVQLASGTDVEANVAAALAGVERAADEGANYALVPEYVTYYGPSRGFAAAAETVPGPSIDRFAEVARRRGIVVHVGSLLERSVDPERFYNTSVVLDAAGEVVATYRKAHLFDIDAPGMASYLESERIVAGDAAVVAHVEGVALGLSICFDLRFPELYRRLVADGAEVLAVPAAFTFATGQHHWDLLVRARAVDSLAFVVAAAQVGTTAEGLATWGHSMIVDPWGEVLAHSDAPGPDVLVATLDLGEVARRRAQLDLTRARRPDLYR